MGRVRITPSGDPDNAAARACGDVGLVQAVPFPGDNRPICFECQAVKSASRDRDNATTRAGRDVAPPLEVSPQTTTQRWARSARLWLKPAEIATTFDNVCPATTTRPVAVNEATPVASPSALNPQPTTVPVGLERQAEVLARQNRHNPIRHTVGGRVLAKAIIPPAGDRSVG